jgi:hypothetical protein
MLRFASALAFAAIVPNFAHAGLADEYGFQAKSVSRPTATAPAAKDGFWSRIQQVLSPESGRESADLSITVTDENGTPLSGASVLVGSGRGAPFTGNEAVTDGSGVASFNNAALRGASLPSVTVSKEGYSTFTLAAPASAALEISLPRYANDADFAFLEGEVNGFPPGYPSNVLEMGFFVPAFRPESLLNFDPQQFVSSYTTTINVFGERDVPGNVILPTQRKRYGFVPISLSKPNFIMPLNLGLKAHMTALAGAVPISDALGAIQNNDFLGAINLASFTHVAWTTNPVEVKGPEKFNLTVNQEIAPKAVKAKLANIPGALDVVAVSLTDPSREKLDFVALDVKAVKAEAVKNGATTVDLGTLKNRREGDALFVFSGVFDREEFTNKEATKRWIVGSLQPVKGSDASFAGFLNPVRSGTVANGNRDYSFASPVNGAIAPDLILLNIVSEKKNAETRGTSRRVIWSAVLPGNVSEAKLPDLGRPVLPSPDQSREESFRWEVIAVKASSAKGADIQSTLRNLAHVSSLSQKF